MDEDRRVEVHEIRVGGTLEVEVFRRRGARMTSGVRTCLREEEVDVL